MKVNFQTVSFVLSGLPSGILHNPLCGLKNTQNITMKGGHTLLTKRGHIYEQKRYNERYCCKA